MNAESTVTPGNWCSLLHRHQRSNKGLRFAILNRFSGTILSVILTNVMKSPNLPMRRRSDYIPAFLPGNLDRDCMSLQQNGVAVRALFKGCVHACVCVRARVRRTLVK